jgi:hypothetical protein
MGAKADFDFQQDSEWIFEKFYKYGLIYFLRVHLK